MKSLTQKFSRLIRQERMCKQTLLTGATYSFSIMTESLQYRYMFALRVSADGDTISGKISLYTQLFHKALNEFLCQDV